MLKANNISNPSKQANYIESRMFLFLFLSVRDTTSSKMRLNNAFRNGCGNKRNANIKKLFLLLKNYLLYDIVWPDKQMIFFTKTKS